MQRLASVLFLWILCLNPVFSDEKSDEELEGLVSLMARVGSCYSPTFAPDGKTLAFVCNLSGLPQIWRVSTNGGWPELVTSMDDPVQNVIWSPDGAWLAFSLAPGGGMNQQVYLVRPNGTELHRLTRGGKENNWLGDWTHDGKSLTFASNIRTGDAMDAYLIDVSDRTTREVAKNEGIGYLLDVSRDQSTAVLYRMQSRSNDNVYLIDLKTSQELLLTPHDGPGSFSGTLSPDGKTVYLSSNKDRDMVAFARIKILSTGKPGPIEVIAERTDAELDNYRLNEQGTQAALVWNVAGRNELSFIDLQNLKMTAAPALPAEIVSDITWSRDGKQLVFACSGAARPFDVWILNLETGQYRQITHSPHAGISLESLVTPELVRFPAEDGLQLSGWLYRPKERKGPGPVVLNFHGGPEGQEQPGFRSNYQALLLRGIAVFGANVRGSSGFGKRFVNMDNGPLRVNGVRDIKACVDYLVKIGIADPKRIGIMGGSYGGYMVMAGLTEFPEMFAAGADYFGVVNFETFFKHTEPWMAAISKIEYGDPETQADLLRNLSPIHKIDRVQAATLVLHGANDTNVPVVEAEQVVENLKKRNIPVEYVLFPDEGHGFQKIPNRIRATVSMVNWFTKYLTR